jgi:hypothetical protein
MPSPNRTTSPRSPIRSGRRRRTAPCNDVAQPVGRDPDWSDTRIGLNYRVAPGLRTGVGVTLGSEQTPDNHQLMPQDPAPRVRLETTFKF